MGELKDYLINKCKAQLDAHIDVASKRIVADVTTPRPDILIMGDPPNGEDATAPDSIARLMEKMKKEVEDKNKDVKVIPLKRFQMLTGFRAL